MRIGFGYDSHRLVKGRPLILGGVEIPYEKGLLGHSDGDVLTHAIVDAIIGALGIGDIGNHFPPTDMRWKDVKSSALLKHIIGLAHSSGFEVSWIDSIVIAEAPLLAPYIEGMKGVISEGGVPQGSINIKAKTNEGMGFTGRKEGICAYAVCLLRKIDRE